MFLRNETHFRMSFEIKDEMMEYDSHPIDVGSERIDVRIDREPPAAFDIRLWHEAACLLGEVMEVRVLKIDDVITRPILHEFIDNIVSTEVLSAECQCCTRCREPDST